MGRIKKKKSKKAGKKVVRRKKKAGALIKQTEVAVMPAPAVPEPKNKILLEYIVHVSPHLLYEFLSTPSGLSEWFADDVNINGNAMVFFWEGSKQEAEIIQSKPDQFIRFRWADKPEEIYFEFRIEKNDITEELSLIITDFAESEEDKKTAHILWDSQVSKLLKLLGSSL